MPRVKAPTKEEKQQAVFDKTTPLPDVPVPSPAGKLRVDTDSLIEKAQPGVTLGDQLGSAFRLGNDVVSAGQYLGAARQMADMPTDPTYIPLDHMTDEEKADAGYYAHARSQDQLDFLRQRRANQQEDEQRLANGPLPSFLAEMPATLLSLTTWLAPGSELGLGANLIRGAAARKALQIGADAAVGAVANEGVMQATQAQRTAADSVANVLMSGFGGAVLGAGAAAAAGRLKAFKAGIEDGKAAVNLVNRQPGIAAPADAESSVGAMRNVPLTEPQAVQVTPDLTRLVGEKAVKMYADAAAKIGVRPVGLGLATSESPMARSLRAQLADIGMVTRGEVKGIRLSDNTIAGMNAVDEGRMHQVHEFTEHAFQRYVQAGGKLNQHDFEAEVHWANFTGDKHADPIIQESAQWMRQNVYEPARERLSATGIMGDLAEAPRGAESYSPINYDIDRLERGGTNSEGETFTQAITRVIEQEAEGRIAGTRAKIDEIDKEMPAAKQNAEKSAADVKDLEGRLAAFEGAPISDEAVGAHRAAVKASKDSARLRRQEYVSKRDELRRLKDVADAHGAVSNAEDDLRQLREEFRAARDKGRKETAELIERRRQAEAELKDARRMRDEQIKQMKEHLKTLKSANDELAGKLSAKEKARSTLDDILSGHIVQRGDAQNIAEEVLHNILANPANRLSRLRIKERGSMKERTLAIDVNVLRPWLRLNSVEAATKYISTVYRDLNFHETFGHMEVEKWLEKFAQETEQRAKEAGDVKMQKFLEGQKEVTEELRAKAEAAKGDEIERIMKKGAEEAELAREAWNRLRGIHDTTASPLYATAVKAMSGLRAATYMSSMGAVLLAQLMDPFSMTLREGFARTFGAAFADLTTGLKGLRMSMREAQRLGTALDWYQHQRMHHALDVGDRYAAKSRFERGTARATDFFSKWTGISAMTTATKGWASMAATTRILENARAMAKAGATKGMSVEELQALAEKTLSSKDLRRMAEAHLSPKDLARIGAQQEHWEDLGHSLIAHHDQWTDPRAMQAFRQGVVHAVDASIITPNVMDTPAWFNTDIGKTIMMFQRFTWAAQQRVFMAGLQYHDMNTLGSAVGMIAIGALSLYARDMVSERGRQRIKDRTDAEWVRDSIDRSGVLGLAFNMAAIPSAFGIPMNQWMSGRIAQHNRDKTPVEALGGPVVQKLGNVARVMGDVMHARPTETTLHNARVLMPFNNHLATGWLFDYAEKAGAKGLGLPQRRKQ